MRCSWFQCIKKKKPGLAAAAGASLLAFSLFNVSVSFAQSEDSDTLKKIAATKTISIGYREDEIPFAYITADGVVRGYTIELCHEIAEGVRRHLKLDKIDINYVVATTATRFLLVKSGKIDLECSATTNNAERRQQVAFSYPHFVTSTRFAAKKASKLNNIRDLAGRTVVSTTGTVNIGQLQSLNRAENLNISVMLAKHNSEGFAFVENNKASAFVMDGVLLAAQIAFSAAPDDYMISSEAFGPPEPYGILSRKDDPVFNKLVNETLKDVFVSGKINDIYNRWFMSPIPPEGRNFNLPMSDELRAAFQEPRALQ